MVTALHVIAGIKSRGHEVALRINTRDGQSALVALPFEMWTCPDQSEGAILDAAACAFPHANDVLDYGYVSDDRVATATLMAEEQLGVGCDVYLAGLFVNHPGKSRNEPIIRSGIISAMPVDEILTNNGYMPGYLIECRSLGGLSGSPVFVESGLFIHDEHGHLNYRRAGSQMWHLLGIIRGHWDVPVDTSSDEHRENINTGIAIVTPFERILPLVKTAFDKGTRENEENARRNA